MASKSSLFPDAPADLGYYASPSDPPKKSRRWVDWLRPFEASLALPWFNRRRPYVALHVYHHGWSIYQGRSREIKVVMLLWGRRFTDRRTYPMKTWDVYGTWRAG